ncbi:MAG: hypothetical protein EVA87_02400 [Rhodospirillaceae bacterium]|nr:MAG: hypothetical protein EVA87_02400 [Rhodospirillaceae bacterium]
MTGRHSYTRQLVDLATPYWDTEAELTRRFFASGPSKDVWIRYLKAAVYKELNPVIGYGPSDGFACGLHMEFARLVEGFDTVDAGMDRRGFHHRLEQMIEEFMHYTVLAEVLEDLLGRPLQRGDAQQLPADDKLNKLRHTYVNSDNAAVRAVMELTEGGGTATFREGAKLTGGDFEMKLAAAFKVIADDEDGHVDHAADDLKNIIETESDFEAAKIALLRVSMQRLHMRNEMFSNVMSAAELNGYLTERGGEPIKI